MIILVVKDQSEKDVTMMQEKTIIIFHLYINYINK